MEVEKAKILVVGDFNSLIHERALKDAFSRLGAETYEFAIYPYISEKGADTLLEKLHNFRTRLENKFHYGRLIKEINEGVKKKAKEVKPDLIFVYRGTHILKATVEELKGSQRKIYLFNNDDPFSHKHPWYHGRHVRKAASLYDHIFVYREKNVADYKSLGCRQVSLLRSYYIKDLHIFTPEETRQRFEYDVVFVGHFENDGRDEYIKTLIDHGFKVGLRGPEWHRSKFYPLFQEKFGIIQPVVGKEYVQMLTQAKIALVFLSKLNNDTYTRRCFEIPAIGTLMLAEYTNDLNSLFKENEEAVYFKSKEDVIKKLDYYLSHVEERNRIARAGHERLMKDGHEVTDRAKTVLDVWLNNK